jgi:hypothetical protein
MPWSFKWPFSFGLFHQNPIHVSPFSHACHMPRSSNIPGAKSHIHFSVPRSFCQRICPCPRLCDVS